MAIPETIRPVRILPTRQRDRVAINPDRHPAPDHRTTHHADTAPGVPALFDLPGSAIHRDRAGRPPAFADERLARRDSVHADRWSGGAWLLLRGGTPSPAFGGQLAGSQGGARIAYAVSTRLKLVARIAAPIHDPGRETSIGVEWRPANLPVRVIAEQRIALDRTHGGPAIGVIGGAGPTPMWAGFDLAGYGQAGVVKRHRGEPFVEGAVRIAHAVSVAGPARIDIGAGLWGGAQRDAARLDIGPSLGVTVPVRGRNLRAAIDWRQRMAGHARPGSGLALTLGCDF